MKYSTCASIAEETPEGMRDVLKAALKRSRYAEARLDFLRADAIPDALGMIKGEMGRVVCTLRPRSEGGAFAGGERERISILKLAAEYNPFLIDVEFETVRRNEPLAAYIESTGTQMLVSWHDFDGTPGSGVLRRRLYQMGRISGCVKMVSTARTARDYSRMLELYSRKGKTSLIAFSMGELGRISRVLCLYLGSPYTYASLGRAVAPGQLSVEEIAAMTDAAW